MSNKYLDEKDYFTCTSGLAPAKMCATQSIKQHKDGTRYLIETGKATQSIGDFFCRWTVVLAAAIAAAGIVTGGAALAVLAVAAVAASTAMCGGLMAPFRVWLNTKSNAQVGGKNLLTARAQMTCPIGGVISLAAGITGFWSALAYTARNTTWAVLEGFFAGKLLAAGGGMFAGGAAGGSASLGAVALKFLQYQVIGRGIGVADQVFAEGMLRDGKSFNETGSYAVTGATIFEQPFISIYDKASKGEMPSWTDVYYAGMSIFAVREMGRAAQSGARGGTPENVREGNESKGAGEEKPAEENKTVEDPALMADSEPQAGADGGTFELNNTEPVEGETGDGNTGGDTPPPQDPPGTYRDANGRLRDQITKKFVTDPNTVKSRNYDPDAYRRSMSERKKALLRDADDPNAELDPDARKFIKDTKGDNVPEGYEVSHEEPLYTRRTNEGKTELDKAENMKTQPKEVHRARHEICGDQYHQFGPANKPTILRD